jgi:hypothetical protein
MSIKLSALALKGESFELKLAEVLTTWPLYRSFIYGAEEHTIRLPSGLDLFCSTCKQHETFKRVAPRYHTGVARVPGQTMPYAETPADVSARYVCKRCESCEVKYYIRWRYHPEDSEYKYVEFTKVGQDPPMEIEPPSELGLDREDRDFYKKAWSCRNFDFGLGALAYLRRVVENRMDDLLDLIAETAKTEGRFTEELQVQLEAVKRENQFTKKIDYSSLILSDRLKPGGRNPLGRLHGLTSEGIHAMPEDKCIDLFDECVTVFEYFFAELRRELAERKGLIGALDKLDQKRAERTSSTKTKASDLSSGSE